MISLSALLLLVSLGRFTSAATDLAWDPVARFVFVAESNRLRRVEPIAP